MIRLYDRDADVVSEALTVAVDIFREGAGTVRDLAYGELLVWTPAEMLGIEPGGVLVQSPRRPRNQPRSPCEPALRRTVSSPENLNTLAHVPRAVYFVFEIADFPASILVRRRP